MTTYKKKTIKQLIHESILKNLIQSDSILSENLSLEDIAKLEQAAKQGGSAFRRAARKIMLNYHPDTLAGRNMDPSPATRRAMENLRDTGMFSQGGTKPDVAAQQFLDDIETFKSRAPEKPATGIPRPTVATAGSGAPTPNQGTTGTPKASAGSGGAGGAGGSAPKIKPKASANLPSNLGKYYAFTPEGGSINRPYSGETYKKLFGTPDSKSLVSTTQSKIPFAQQNVRVYQVIEQSSRQVKLVQVNPNTGKPIPGAKPISRTLSTFKDMSPLKATTADWFNKKFNPLSKDYRNIKTDKKGDIAKMIQRRAKALNSGKLNTVKTLESSLRARGIDIESLSSKTPGSTTVTAPKTGGPPAKTGGSTTVTAPKTGGAGGGGGSGTQVTAKVPPNANTNPAPITKVTPAEIAKVQAHPQGANAIQEVDDALTKLLPAAPPDEVAEAAKKVVTNSWKDVAKQTLGKGLENLKNVRPRTVIGGAALSAAMPFIERYATGSGEDVTADEVVYSVGTGLVITGISVAFPPAGLAILAGAVVMGGLQYWDEAVGDMSNVWERIKREGEKKVGFATEGGTRDVWAPAGGSPGWFFKQKDFWQYVDKKYPGKYTNGVLKPGDLGKEETEKILMTMYIMKAARKDPEQKPLISDILAGKNLNTHPAAHDFNAMNNCFVYGYLDMDAWFQEYKKTFPKPGPIKIDVIKEDGGQEGKTGGGEGEGGETVPDPGEKVTKRFDWDKYVGSDPIESDKQQIKALWIQSVAEKVGSKKSFNSWARWYKNLYTQGEIGIDNQKLEDGQVLGGSGKNKNFKPGKHLSADQVEFIMRKIHKGQDIPKDLGPIKENKMTISKSSLERILKTI